MRQVVLGSHGCLWQQMNVRDARKRVSDADRAGKKKKGYVMLAKHEQKVRFRMRILLQKNCWVVSPIEHEEAGYVPSERFGVANKLSSPLRSSSLAKEATNWTMHYVHLGPMLHYRCSMEEVVFTGFLQPR